ncbi:hypothetical protein [Pseudorhodoferax sp. Leaf267]|uniref:hypothetical protein n=1 Tax=Pseudorhodoferax sp. Leaf267 TaxID=1736316 RepID=UPI0019107D01|nr:hypothetical protein [Pseudorhodoferax sp. Leaf267]
MLEQKPEPGAVPTSSSRNRFANKRMLVICGAIAVVVVLFIVLRVLSSSQA